MRIDQLELVNFKGFENAKFSFTPGINVIIGENGTGKTSILDAISSHLAYWANRLSQKKVTYDFSKDRRVVFDGVSFVPVGKTLILTVGKVFENQEWRYAESRLEDIALFFHRNDEDIKRDLPYIASQTLDNINNISHPLPIVSHFDISIKGSEQINGIETHISPANILSGYYDSLTKSPKYKLLTDWLKNRYIAHLQGSVAGDGYHAVQDALSKCMENWEWVEYLAEIDDLVIVQTEEKTSGKKEVKLPISLLSEGMKVWFAIICEIALRASVLNPKLGKEAHLQTPGVVLIDEIDQHIHPRWQMKQLEGLRRAFPKMQFIVTTHSPFIIQGLDLNKGDQLIDLDYKIENNLMDEPDNNAENYYVQRGIALISKHIMGVKETTLSTPARQKERTAEEILTQISSGQMTEEEWAECEQLFADDPAFLASLRIKYLLAKGPSNAPRTEV